MRPFSVYIPLLAGVATALMSLDANAGDSFVDVRSVDPTIVVELRYAGRNNLLGQPLYPYGMRALTRREVALALARAQAFLRHYQYGLKIWDAYRPVAVQAKLWEASHNSDYVADPETGAGSLHSWGIAVDATLVDSWNNPVRMPSDFDDFTPAAMWRYMGPSPEVRAHVRLLQNAMLRAGFWGSRTEWWHYTIAHWQKYLPAEKAKRAGQILATHWGGTL
jgi:D-alanyl-D-alanine dipeptidase